MDKQTLHVIVGIILVFLAFIAEVIRRSKIENDRLPGNREPSPQLPTRPISREIEEDWVQSPSGTAKIVKKRIFGRVSQEPEILIKPPGPNTIRVTGLSRPREAVINDEGFTAIVDWGSLDKLDGTLVFIQPDGTLAQQHEFKVNLGKLVIEPNSDIVFLTTACSQLGPGILLCYEIRTGQLRWKRDSPKPAAEIVVVPSERCILVGRPYKSCGSDYVEKISFEGALIERWPDSPYEALTLGETERQSGNTVKAEHWFLIVANSEISPSFRAQAFRALGEIAEESARPSEALDYYNKAVAVYPKIGVKRRIQALKKQLSMKESE